MIKIRLARGGRKKLPYYRILVTNSTSPRDSKFIEKIGSYNPLLKADNENRINLDKERAEYWLSVGAKPTERVAKFLIELAVKGAVNHKPKFTPKAKGEGLKKKALERLENEKKAKEEAAAKAAEQAKAQEEEKAAAQQKAQEEKNLVKEEESSERTQQNSQQEAKIEEAPQKAEANEKNSEEDKE